MDSVTATREHIAAEVRAELARQQKVQRDLAAVLQVDAGSANLRLSGKRSFRAEELVTIADWLGVPVIQFLGAPERAA